MFKLFEMKVNKLCEKLTWGAFEIFVSLKPSDKSSEKPSQPIPAFSRKRNHKRKSQNAKKRRIEENLLMPILNKPSSIFLNLTELTINNCGLQELTRDDLKGLVNLKKMFVDSNNLSSLPSDLFNDLKKLKVISFHSNKLEVVNSEMLLPIVGNGLTKVDFRCNKKINAVFEANHPKSVSLGQLFAIMDKKCKTNIKKHSKTSSDDFDFEDYKKESSSNLVKLWTSGLHSDFTVVVDSKKFRVHKSILAAKSLFLTADSNRISIHNYSASTVERSLEFLYTGKLRNQKRMTEVFAFSSTYGITDLRAISEDIVSLKVDLQNLLPMLKLGILYQSEKLKRAAFEEIRRLLPQYQIEDEIMNDLPVLEQLINLATVIQNSIIQLREANEAVKSYQETKDRYNALVLQSAN